MEKLNDLRALLGHNIEDLRSAEHQILEALPLMIEKAKSPQLKQALQEHLEITRGQVNRLDKALKLLNGKKGKDDKGLLGGLFSGGSEVKCLAMEGIIREAKHHMKEDMSPEVMDAAIIASAQKVEHYEICGYGTARAWAQQLDLNEVAELLEETLDEEYEADDRLTDLAVGQLNEEAESAGSEASVEEEAPELQLVSATRSGGRSAAKSSASGTGGRKAPAPSKSAPARGTGAAPRSAASGSSARSTSASKSATPASRGAAAKKSSGGRSGSSSARGRK